jgi:hypothetical protein
MRVITMTIIKTKINGQLFEIAVDDGLVLELSDGELKVRKAPGRLFPFPPTYTSGSIPNSNPNYGINPYWDNSSPVVGAI